MTEGPTQPGDAREARFRGFVSGGVRTRITVLVVAAVLVFSFGTGQLLIAVQERAMYEEERQRAAALLETLAVPCALALSMDELVRIDEYLEELSVGGGRRMGLVRVAMLDPEGRVVALSGAGALETRTDLGRAAQLANRGAGVDGFHMRASESDRALWWRRRGAAGAGLLDVSMPAVSGLRWGTLVATFNLNRVDSRLAEIRHVILVSAAVLAFAMMWVLYVGVARLVLRPITVLHSAARALGDGDLSARAELTSQDEFGRLAKSFNGMAAELETYTTSLEGMVRERTAEVEQQNVELEAVNERLAMAVEKLDKLARTDPLTGLFNRRVFQERLGFEIRRAARTGYPLALLMADIDHFKAINDRHGHPTGDGVLVQVADGLRESVRATDIVARIGGEEFAILLLDTTRDDAMAVAEKVRTALSRPNYRDEDGQSIGTVTISVGVAMCPEDAEDEKSLLRESDTALYVAKDTGRDQVVAWTAGMKRPKDRSLGA